MNIYSALRIGAFHTNHCEDFLIIEPIASNRYVVAVLDGCTMGKESVFASILYGKILRKAAKHLYYQDFWNKSDPKLKTILNGILRQLFVDVKAIKQALELENDELLSTLIIGVLDESNRTAEFLTLGDGIIYHDGQLIEYDQNDKPDYLGYHLNESFDDWYDQQNQVHSISSFNDLSVSTDGIFSFKNLENPRNPQGEKQIIEFLLKDSDDAEHENLLDRKLRLLEREKQLVPTDDLAIIRLRVN